MVIILDNGAGFPFNIYQYVGNSNTNVKVINCDGLVLCELIELNPTHLIISSDSNNTNLSELNKEIILYFKDKLPILSIGSGINIICKAFKGEIINSETLSHGKKETIHIANGSPIFYGLPPITEAGNYITQNIKKDTLPEELLIIAEDNNGEIRGIKHRDYDIYGIQFHPESVLTKFGYMIIENFLKIGG